MLEKLGHETALVSWLAVNAPWVVAGIIAFIMSLFRAWFVAGRLSGVKGKNISEAAMCLVFVSTSRPVFIDYVSDEKALFFGGLIGIAGARVIIPVAEAAAKRIGGRQ